MVSLGHGIGHRHEKADGDNRAMLRNGTPPLRRTGDVVTRKSLQSKIKFIWKTPLRLYMQ